MTIFDRIIEEHGDAGLLALVKSMRANGLHFTASQIEKAHPGLGVQVNPLNHYAYNCTYNLIGNLLFNDPISILGINN